MSSMSNGEDGSTLSGWVAALGVAGLMVCSVYAAEPQDMRNWALEYSTGEGSNKPVASPTSARVKAIAEEAAVGDRAHSLAMEDSPPGEDPYENMEFAVEESADTSAQTATGKSSPVLPVSPASDRPVVVEKSRRLPNHGRALADNVNGATEFEAEEGADTAAQTAEEHMPPLEEAATTLPDETLMEPTQGTAEQPPIPPATAATAPVMAPVGDQYIVQPGDILQVTVWKEEDLEREVLVRPDGGISFPLAGDVPAAGHTVEQIQQQLTARIEKYIPEPVVTVAVRHIVGNRVYVVGRVNKPGEIIMGQELTIMQALSLAGGVTPFAALNKIHVLRKEGGVQRSIPFRYADVEKGRNLQQNMVLENGDVVVVP